MEKQEIIKGFEQLGLLMQALGENKEWVDFSTGLTEDEYLEIQKVINRQISYNGWFTNKNVQQSLYALGIQLSISN